MQIDLYNKYFQNFITDPTLKKNVQEAVEIITSSKRVFFIGNGGSNSICSHMMEDFAKTGGFPTFTFSDPSLITCFANDYGYERAMEEWLKIHYGQPGDLLIAISSSGESQNIINAVNSALSINGNVISLSGFKPQNRLSKTGKVNFIIPVENYGIVECFHQVILHILLDTIVASR